MAEAQPRPHVVVLHVVIVVLLLLVVVCSTEIRPRKEAAPGESYTGFKCNVGV